MNPKELTWETMIKFDSRLEHLYQKALDAQTSDGWLADQLWFGSNEGMGFFGLKASLWKLVGWFRNEASYPELHSEKAYEIAYRKIYNALWIGPEQELSRDVADTYIRKYTRHYDESDGYGHPIETLSFLHFNPQ